MAKLTSQWWNMHSISEVRRYLGRSLAVLSMALLAISLCVPTAQGQWTPPDEQPQVQVGEGGNDATFVGVIVGAGILIGIGIEAGWGVVSDFFGDLWDSTFGSGDEPSAPTQPTAAQVMTETGNQVGSGLGANATVSSPNVTPERLPTPTVQPDFGQTMPLPPQTQGGDGFRPDVKPVPTAADPGSSAANTDPVDLHRGEFIHSAIDVQVAGIEPPLALVRSYRSRVNFKGPLGSAWDHNYNARVYAGAENELCPREVTVSLGNLAPIVMRPVDEVPAELSDTYRPIAPGVNLVLRRIPSLLNEGWAWQLLLPNQYVYTFGSAGLLETIAAPNGNFLYLIWGETEHEYQGYQLRQVKRYIAGAVTHTLDFLYDDQEEFVERVELRAAPDPATGVMLPHIAVVEYDYTPQEALESVTAGGEVREKYTYRSWSGNSDEDLVQLEGLSDFCSNLCQETSPLGCGAPSYCEQYATTTSANCEPACETACGDACLDFYRDALPGFLDQCKGQGASTAACIQHYNDNEQHFMDACSSRCSTKCTDTCKNPTTLEKSCNETCESSCMALASDPTKYRYGVPRDLRFNLATITDAEDKLIVSNEYGDDPIHPDFDAVVRQAAGRDGEERALTLTYFDFAPPNSLPPSASEPASGDVMPLPPDFSDIVSGGVKTEPELDPPSLFSSVVQDYAPKGDLQICVPDAEQASMSTRAFVPYADGRVLFSVDAFSGLEDFDLFGATASSTFLMQALESGGLAALSPRAPAGGFDFVAGDVAGSFGANSSGVLMPEEFRTSITLTATREYATTSYVDGVRTFSAPFVLDLPARLRVLEGNAGNHHAWLSFKTADGQLTRCRYVGGSKAPHPVSTIDVARGDYYNFDRCNGSSLAAGATVSVLSITLHVAGGDQRNPAGKTTIRAVLEHAGDLQAAPASLLEFLGAQAGDILVFARIGGEVTALGIAQGVAALVQGGCYSGFFGTTTAEGFRMEPPAACSGELELVPLTGFSSQGTTTWQFLTGGDGSIHLQSAGGYDPGLWVLDKSGAAAIDVSAWAAAWRLLTETDIDLVDLLGERQGEASLPPCLPRTEFELDDLIDGMKVFEASFGPDSDDELSREIADIWTDADELIDSSELPERLDDILGPLGFAPVSSCEERCKNGELSVPKKLRRPRPQGRARWGTLITGAGDVRASYYTKTGENVRLFNISRSVIEDYEYDADRNRKGAFRHGKDSLQPLEPVACGEFDHRGMTTALTHSAMDGSHARTQCYDYDAQGPWLSAATVPGDITRELFRRDHNRAGLVVSDANAAGDETVFFYDDKGRLLRSFTPDGVETTYSDHAFYTGMAKTIATDDGTTSQVTNVAFDLFGRVKRIERNGWGPDEEWGYDGPTRLESHTITSELGESVTTYEYYDNGQLKAVRGPDVTALYEYDSAGFMDEVTQISKSIELKACYRYRADGSLESTVDPLGAVWTESFTRSGTDEIRTTSVGPNDSDPSCPLPPSNNEGAIPSGVVNRVRVNGANRIVDAEDALGVVTSYGYEPAFGQMVTWTRGSDSDRIAGRTYLDAEDRPVAYALTTGKYSPPPMLTEASVAAIQGGAFAEFFSYDDAGRLRAKRTYGFDVDGQVHKASDVSSTFNAGTREVAVTALSEGGTLTSQYAFDTFGRLVAASDSAGGELSVEYPSPLSRRLTRRGPSGRDIVTTEEFTSFGAVDQVLDGADNVLVDNEYDEQGRLTRATDETDAELTLDYSGFSKVRHVERTAQDEVLESTSYRYDSRGRLFAVEVGGKEVASYSFDLLGRVALERRPDLDGTSVSRTTTYVGVTHLPHQVFEPSGRTHTHHYDDLGRLETVVSDASSIADLVGPSKVQLSLAYSPLGAATDVRLFDVTGQSAKLLSRVEYGYDGLGRRVSETQHALKQTIERSYGLGGGLSTVTVDGAVYRYGWTPDGRLSSIEDTEGNSLLSLAYKGAGSAQSVTLGNGVTEKRQFDARGRVTAQDLSVLKLTYGYGTDGLNRRMTTSSALLTQSLLMKTDPSGRLAGELRMEDGDLSSLTSGQITNSSIQALSGQASESVEYGLDAANNWDSVTSSLDGVYNPSPAPNNAYQQTPFGAADYDLDGRLTAAGSRSYQYDALGRLARVVDGATECSFEYDGTGRRVQEVCNGVQTNFGYDGDNLILDETGDRRAVTLHQGALSSPFARIVDGSVSYLVASADHSVRAVLDGSGAVVEQYGYSAFGRTSVHQFAGESSGNRFGFQGHIRDDATGLYQMRARYYSPHMGRFITQDPIGAAGGANLYAFTSNRPHAQWDPYGLAPGVFADSQPLSPRLANALPAQGRPPGAPPDVEYFTVLKRSDRHLGAGMQHARNPTELNQWAENLPPYAQVFRVTPGSGLSMEGVRAAAEDAVIADNLRRMEGDLTNAGLAISTVPVFGDAGALGTSLFTLTLNPSFMNALAVGGDSLGLLPGVPALGTGSRAARLALDAPDAAAAANRILNGSEAGARAALRVASGAGEATPGTIVREISHGEKIDDLINEGKVLTFATGNEHALLSLATGQRVIVAGGPTGIDLSSFSIRRLLAHSHPYHLPPTGPSRADFDAISTLGQRRSYLLEHGVLLRFGSE